MSVDDIDGEGTHVGDLDPRRLISYLDRSITDLGSHAHELVMADMTFKTVAAQRFNDTVAEFLALAARHAQVDWVAWERAEKLHRVAEDLRELGETADADRLEAQANELAADAQHPRGPIGTGDE